MWLSKNDLHHPPHPTPYLLRVLIFLITVKLTFTVGGEHCGCVGGAAIARIKPLYLEGGQFLDVDRKQVAVLGQVATGEQLDYLPALMGQAEIVVMSTLDWQVGVVILSHN